MADLVEVRVRHLNNIIAVPVNASGVQFQFFGNSSPINLKFCDIEKKLFAVSFSRITHIIDYINANGTLPEPADTPQFTAPQWHELWVSWNKGIVRVGMAGECKPFVQKAIRDTHKVNRIEIFGVDSRWKFYLPPVKPQDEKRSIDSAELRWVAVDDKIPRDAVIGGHENEPLYVIRGPHRGSMTPGKMAPSSGTAYISWGGEDHELDHFEALVGSNYKWQSTKDDKIPYNAFVGGHSESNEELYIGRAYVDDHLLIGKVQPSHKVCYVPYMGSEMPIKMFEILVRTDDTINSRLLNDRMQEDNNYNRIMRGLQRHQNAGDDQDLLSDNDMGGILI